MKRDGKMTEKMSRREILLIHVITIIYAVCVFFFIGDHRVPETCRVLKSADKTNEVIVSFDGAVSIQKAYIYLGSQSGKRLSFSFINYEAGVNEWEVIEKDREIVSVFCWNEVPIERTLEHLGIVLMDDYININEIVFIGKNGEIVTPNANTVSTYRELFDESGLFNGYRSFINGTYFDEVYHGRTAYEFISGEAVYEWTHPALGKTLISLGIRAFGMNPFGWRLVVALFGTAMIPLMYIFARKVFKNILYAVFSTVIFATMFMNFSLSRIATIDIIIAFFILLTFFFMFMFTEEIENGLKSKKIYLYLGLSGVSFGLAIATKWTGFYAGMGIAIIFFIALFRALDKNGKIVKNKDFIIRLAAFCVVFFIIVPGIIYLLSYIPYKKTHVGESLFKIMINNSKSMFEYHSRVTADHPYASPWYEWVINKKPLLDEWATYPDGKISMIATFLSPSFTVLSILAVIINLYLAIVKKDKKAFFFEIAYFSMLAPWWFVKRTVFIYQYFGSAIMAVFLITNAVQCIYRKTEKSKRIALCVGAGICLVSIVMFIMFYPIISGWPVEYDVIKNLRWFPRWPY